MMLDETQFAQQRGELAVSVLPLDLKRVAQNARRLVATSRGPKVGKQSRSQLS